jgi:hypothetical protein
MTNTASLGAFLRGFETTEPAPYLDITESDASARDLIPLADAVIADGWKPGPETTVRLEPPIAWDEVCSANRSWEYNLHAWTPLAAVLGAFEQTGELQYLLFALVIALDWVRVFRSLDTPSPFAWYDMGLGMRACRLAFIVDRSIRRRLLSEEQISLLHDSILLHRDAFADDGRFASHSNHGLYFAAGQLALARAFPWVEGMRDAQAQARGRLSSVIRSQFTDEGIHREHSPEYHRMILQTVVSLERSGLVDDPELTELIGRADEALSWLVLPNGRLAMLGDSPGRILGRGTLERAISPALRFEVSAGATGSAPPESLKVFPRSGYAIVRTEPDGAAGERSYLLQNAAFHSRVHKHADDLSILWYDHGQEILIDPGRFGYLERTAVGSELWLDGFWYAHPDRLYVESTRAHSCVEIDERNCPRRGVRPYGSALRRWGRSGDVYAIESSVRQHGSIVQTRTLLFRPGRFLVVVDDVVDERGEAHEMAQRFQLAPELDVELHEATLGITLPEGRGQLAMTSLVGDEPLPLVSGARSPRSLGWISRVDGRLEPAHSAGYVAGGTSRHVFATLFAFASSAPLPAGFRDLTSGLWLAWSDDEGRHEIAVERRGEPELSIEHTVVENHS